LGERGILQILFAEASGFSSKKTKNKKGKSLKEQNHLQDSRIGYSYMYLYLPVLPS
jgi:hypothetical protein